MNSGYSKTPLWKKIGFTENQSILIINSYSKYFDDVGIPFEINNNLEFTDEHSIDLIHYFGLSLYDLDQLFPVLKTKLNYSGSLWISWPKKTSKVSTDLDGNIVRKIGLNYGLVDVKVAAINKIWSGLKFVYRKEDRKHD